MSAPLSSLGFRAKLAAEKTRLQTKNRKSWIGRKKPKPTQEVVQSNQERADEDFARNTVDEDPKDDATLEQELAEAFLWLEDKDAQNKQFTARRRNYYRQYELTPPPDYIPAQYNNIQCTYCCKGFKKFSDLSRHYKKCKPVYYDDLFPASWEVRRNPDQGLYAEFGEADGSTEGYCLCGKELRVGQSVPWIQCQELCVNCTKICHPKEFKQKNVTELQKEDSKKRKRAEKEEREIDQEFSDDEADDWMHPYREDNETGRMRRTI